MEEGRVEIVDTERLGEATSLLSSGVRKRKSNVIKTGFQYVTSKLSSVKTFDYFAGIEGKRWESILHNLDRKFPIILRMVKLISILLALILAYFILKRIMAEKVAYYDAKGKRIQNAFGEDAEVSLEFIQNPFEILKSFRNYTRSSATVQDHFIDYLDDGFIQTEIYQYGLKNLTLLKLKQDATEIAQRWEAPCLCGAEMGLGIYLLFFPKDKNRQGLGIPEDGIMFFPQIRDSFGRVFIRKTTWVKPDGEALKIITSENIVIQYIGIDTYTYRIQLSGVHAACVYSCESLVDYTFPEEGTNKLLLDGLSLF